MATRTARIVLATNVAETRLTALAFGDDAGTAARSAASFAAEQLMVEPISQAAANQRAVSLRARGRRDLYPLVRRAGLQWPSAFHRSGKFCAALASMDSGMKALHRDWKSSPSSSRRRRAMTDGYQLVEPGAVDDDNELTPVAAR
jgi:ATP-dependent helicase HrpA